MVSDTMKKGKKKKKRDRLPLRHSPRCSFLTVSLYGTMRKEEKEKKRRDCLPLRYSPGCTFLKVSLHGTS